KTPLDARSVTAAFGALPKAMAPEHLVLTPGDPQGSLAGKPVDWEEFFNVTGDELHLLMVLPEHSGGAGEPKAADMTYRVAARRHGNLAPEDMAATVRVWMNEDFDAVTMRAWVLRKPMLVVFPQVELERQLLDSPELAQLETRLAVYVNTKDATSGIRQRSAARLEQDLGTAGVQRPELVLVKVESNKKKGSEVRLDDLVHKPVNRAFAKDTPTKVLEWVLTRVAAGAGSGKP
ncbi:MAG: hypothetical protein ACOYMN_20240, partial [Roseimicrobium sp.]